jgi:hypothetical protein
MGQVQKQSRFSSVSKNSILGYIKPVSNMQDIFQNLILSGMIIVNIYLLTKQISLIYFLIFIENK